MPPRVAPALAGGRRIKQSKSKGPSKALVKQRKDDDKERRKREEKANRGNLRNDTTMAALSSIAKGTAGIIVVFAVFIQIVKRVKTSPTEAAEALAQTLLWILREHGATIAATLTATGAVGAAVVFGRRAMESRAAKAQLTRELERVDQARANNRVRRKQAATTRAERLQQRQQRMMAMIRAEEAELARIRELHEQATEVERARWAEIEAAAALWAGDEQARLDAALAEVHADVENQQRRWEAIAALLGTRSPEACLARVQYIRKQAQLQAEAQSNAFMDGDGLDADWVEGEDDVQPGQVNYANWYRRQYVEESEDDGDGGDDENDGDDGADDDEAMRERVELDHEQVRKGTEIRLEGVMMWKAGFVRVETLGLELSCTRCSSKHDVSLSGDWADEASWAKHCETCTTILRCSLRPCMVHEEASTLAFVDTSKCTVKDVLPSSLHVECIDCEDLYTLPPLRRGIRLEKTCHSCHHKMAFEAKQIVIDCISADNAGGGRAAVKAKAKASRGPTIKEGQPLPNNGACDHFKKSYRWLRFPCCGKAWPCPICHELSGCDGGSMGVLANRMICGKCSHEQNYANSACDACKFHMGKSKGGGAHWNGGGGNRDTSTLSRKDHRKNKGVSRSGALKTASKKNERVGAKGKAKRTKESDA